MSLRLIDIVVPESGKDRVITVLKEIREDPNADGWSSETYDGRLCARLLVPTEESDALLDKLEKMFLGEEGYRFVVSSVQATLPRITPLDKPESSPEHKAELIRKRARVAREELYTGILDSSRFSRSFTALVMLSAIVAAVGILRNNVAVIIGAMVIAPLLGPNVGLALATTLGDSRLARKSLWTIAGGTIIAVGVGAIFGIIFKPDPNLPELALRTSAGWWDVALALASGTAGILCFTLGLPAAMVGVMVALSMLPPLTACGLLLGSAEWSAASGAALLFLANLICLNVAGVATFVTQGVQPLRWSEKKTAHRVLLKSAVIWTVLLATLGWLLSGPATG